MAEETPEMKASSPPKSLALPIIGGTITLEDALDEEENMLLELDHPNQRFDFFFWICQHRKDLQGIISDQLNLTSGETCRLGEVREWRHGSFNACVPIYVDNWKKHPGKRLMLRLPLPYRIGESTRSGNVEEKLRTEAATYIWIEETCPDIPTPCLWAFGLPGGKTFMRLDKAPLRAKVSWYFRRLLSSVLGSPVPSRYVSYDRQKILERGYMIMDYIEPTEAKMLADSWTELRHNQTRRTNLIRDLSRIILSLSRVPLPQIGSWTIDNQCILTLTNRPLFNQFHVMENQGMDSSVPRNLTYTATDGLYADLLACHDQRIYSQPNSILDESDGLSQMATLFTMRGLLPYFADRSLRYGPFVFGLTDLNSPNIFVDNDGHIKYLIDLEWGCSLPVQMLTPPYWLTDRAIDEIGDDGMQEFDTAHEEFMKIFEEEEQTYPSLQGSKTFRTDIMRKTWRSGGFWYFHSLRGLKGCFNLFTQYIQPIFDKDVKEKQFRDVVSCYWAMNVQQVVKDKLADKAEYEVQVRRLFETSAKEPGADL